MSVVHFICAPEPIILIATTLEITGAVVSPVGGGVVEPVSLNEIMPAAFATTAPEPVPSEILTVAVPALVVIETRYEVFAFNFAM